MSPYTYAKLFLLIYDSKKALGVPFNSHSAPHTHRPEKRYNVPPRVGWGVNFDTRLLDQILTSTDEQDILNVSLFVYFQVVLFVLIFEMDNWWITKERYQNWSHP